MKNKVVVVSGDVIDRWPDLLFVEVYLIEAPGHKDGSFYVPVYEEIWPEFTPELEKWALRPREVETRVARIDLEPVHPDIWAGYNKEEGILVIYRPTEMEKLKMNPLANDGTEVPSGQKK